MRDAKDTCITICNMENLDAMGVHSGDFACVIPPQSLSADVIETVRDYTRRIALGLQIQGLLNIQMAVKDDVVYVLEVNPRSSRTIPFVAKATGVPLAKLAAKVMLGHKLRDLDVKNHFFKKSGAFYCRHKRHCGVSKAVRD